MKKYNIEIEFKAGSDFQQELFDTHLKVFMAALKEGTLRGHKKNTVHINLQGEEV